MPDITAISAGLNALKYATDIVKYLRSVGKDFEQAEFKLKLADLTELLAEIKVKLVEAQEENLALSQEISECRRQRDFRSMLRIENNVYVPSAGEIEGYGSGPWCTKCFDTAGLLVTLHHKLATAVGSASGGWATSYKYECPNCKSAGATPKI